MECFTRTCPLDGELVTRYWPDNVALIEIMNLKCYCMQKTQGCQWMGLLMDLEEHLSGCDCFEPFACPYFAFRCNFCGNRMEITQHLVEQYNEHGNLLKSESEKISLENINKSADGGKTLIEINDKIMIFESLLIKIFGGNMEMCTLMQLRDIIDKILMESEGNLTFLLFRDKYNEILKMFDSGDVISTTFKTPIGDAITRVKKSNGSLFNGESITYVFPYEVESGKSSVPKEIDTLLNEESL